ncbi:aminotransferase class V-fold PLP-dependent enzyme [Salmonella enterica subsp. enterica serovar Louisiana]|uniref:Aminotransferase class V-fold PLP-dependent enzyme n=1 Tax=Salmonella enterica subsp. enterica serovar Strasbourg TaxID=682796 RepID=A0A5X7KA29_SALET|nr:aminotransferase class V-fold PLP-dependent enzyme [Salmonella enterica subsp. enterica serovar Louisiana]EBS5544186.1 aminotransferase class V-fold PLP-dependent enzyme [Salmonella enterica subsp. enterica serovar Plymouth]EBY3151945.1 aminotransferase class V-fold PLP-dependent enzyme [Salmonella enterica subsp. enterica serovar Teshie]ECA1252989.1 aminotransferase class V-fold PLP-dependent enzyme [Salmonella enterica subsp. enterica serovar Chailey]ECA7544118.1 aminotransferase class V-f
MASKNNNEIATMAIHAGNQADPAYNAIFPPIVTASSFIQPNLNEEGDFCYSRVSNPTRKAYESALADLEDGIYATATASGMAATNIVMELLPKDSHIISMKGVYGGTWRLFEKLKVTTAGTTISYIDLNDEESLEESIKANTALIWIESPTNPLLELVDIHKVCQFAKQHNILTCVDNTFASAWNHKPLSMGADIVMLSTSKYIGGHSDLIGGAVITNDEKLASRLDFIKTTIGSVASPFDAYLALRGMKTLDVRLQRQCSNAQYIAEYLEQHPAVARVSYPGLPSHPQYRLCKKQMRTGGAVVTATLKGNLQQLKGFISGLQYFVLAESLGGVESMINHSASMSHASMSEEEREAIGICDTTIRFSVGIENVDDLIEDLERALSHMGLRQDN